MARTRLSRKATSDAIVSSEFPQLNFYGPEDCKLFKLELLLGWLNGGGLCPSIECCFASGALIDDFNLRS